MLVFAVVFFLSHPPSRRPQDLSDVRTQSKEADSTLQMDCACSCPHRWGKTGSIQWQGDFPLVTYTSFQPLSMSTHWAAALVHPDAALLLICICGLESQEVLPCTQAIIITHHTHDQVQRVSVQHILPGSPVESTFILICTAPWCWIHEPAARLSQLLLHMSNQQQSCILLLYSHTGPVRPLWLHTSTRPESSPCLRARRAAFHLAVK